MSYDVQVEPERGNKKVIWKNQFPSQLSGALISGLGDFFVS